MTVPPMLIQRMMAVQYFVGG